MGWLAEEVEDLLSSIVALGTPAIANHQTHHEVNNELSRRLEASDAGNRRPEQRNVTPVLGMAPCV